MMAVMSLASRLEAEEASKKEEIIGRLQVENQVCFTYFFHINLGTLLIRLYSNFNHHNIM